MTTLIATKFCTNSSHGSVADCTDVDSTVVVVLLYFPAMAATVMRAFVFFPHKFAASTTVTSVLAVMMSAMRNTMMPSPSLAWSQYATTEHKPDDRQEPISSREHRSLLQTSGRDCGSLRMNRT